MGVGAEETWHPVLGSVGHVQDLMKEREESKSTARVDLVVRKHTVLLLLQILPGQVVGMGRGDSKKTLGS